MLVLRTTTERPEAIQAGTAKLVGVETEAIVEQAEVLLGDQMEYRRMATAISPYGDGHAAERIVDAIRVHFEPLSCFGVRNKGMLTNADLTGL